MIANADAARIPLPDKSVHCVPTSPPYYGPRKYKGKQERDWPAVSYSPMPGLPPLEVPAMRCELGREKTPEAYVAHLVLCFREVYRVLRDDGTAWCVIGDSFTNDTKWGGASGGKNYTSAAGGYEGQRAKRQTGVAPGNLLAIPYRLLLALQADGWLVRNDVVWQKMSPMPESVSGTHWTRHQIKLASGQVCTQPSRASSGSNHKHRDAPGGVWQGGAQYVDCPGCEKCIPHGGYVLRRGSWRHTRSHETVLMLTKGMQYYSDQERVREKSTGQTGSAANFQRESKEADIPGQAHKQHRDERDATEDNGYRNPRDVLTPAPSPFKGEHYAAFPPDLIRPLILSSAPLKCCPECGAGWAAVVENTGERETHGVNHVADLARAHEPLRSNGTRHGTTSVFSTGTVSTSNVLGYRPTCTCHVSTDALKAEYGLQGIPGEVTPAPVPGLVLDPFAGSGTTGLVCRELGLRFVGLDISGEYLRDIALVRSERLTPDSAMVNLPLFELLHS